MAIEIPQDLTVGESVSSTGLHGPRYSRNAIFPVGGLEGSTAPRSPQSTWPLLSCSQPPLSILSQGVAITASAAIGIILEGEPLWLC